MYCIEESTCDNAGTFLRCIAPLVRPCTQGSPTAIRGHGTPAPPVVTTLLKFYSCRLHFLVFVRYLRTSVTAKSEPWTNQVVQIFFACFLKTSRCAGRVSAAVFNRPGVTFSRCVFCADGMSDGLPWPRNSIASFSGSVDQLFVDSGGLWALLVPLKKKGRVRIPPNSCDCSDVIQIHVRRSGMRTQRYEKYAWMAEFCFDEPYDPEQTCLFSSRYLLECLIMT